MAYVTKIFLGKLLVVPRLDSSKDSVPEFNGFQIVGCGLQIEDLSEGVEYSPDNS